LKFAFIFPHAGADLMKAKSTPLYAFLLKEAGLGETCLEFENRSNVGPMFNTSWWICELYGLSLEAEPHPRILPLQRHNRFLNTLERTEIRNLVDSWSLTTVLFQMQDWNILICMLVNLLVCISPEGVQTSWCTNGRAMCSTSISGLPWEVRIECPKGYPEESWEEWSRTGTNPNNCWSFDGHPLVLQTPQICGAFFGAQPINDPRKEHIYIFNICIWMINQYFTGTPPGDHWLGDNSASETAWTQWSWEQDLLWERMISLFIWHLLFNESSYIRY
jgi:hypothetical protein